MTKQFLTEMYAPLTPTLAKMKAALGAAKGASYCRDHGRDREAANCAKGIHEYLTAP